MQISHLILAKFAKFPLRFLKTQSISTTRTCFQRLANKAHFQNLDLLRLIADSSSSLSGIIYEQLGLALPCCWLGIRIPQRALLKGLKLSKSEFTGDIDFFGGNLQPESNEKYLQYVEEFKDEKAHPSWAYKFAQMQILHRGEIKWIPSFDYTAASECKAHYLNADGKLKATSIGRQKHHRKQAKELCELGFDKVALIRIVVTEPINSTKIHPWLEASNRGNFASDKLEKEIKVDETDSFGTMIVSVGAIAGGLEEARGSVSCKYLKDVPQNPLIKKATAIRKVMEDNLANIMNQFPTPKNIPVLLLACSNKSCQHIYITETNLNIICPRCNSQPR
jgi:hypothetical protein